MFLIKKTLNHPRAIEEDRPIFRNKVKKYEGKNYPIIYIDESGFAHDMPRTHGYAPIGKRCYGTCDWHAKGRTNVIGALLGKLLLTVSLFNANINADIFYAWIVKDLLPKLPDNSVLIVNGASFHKRNDIRDVIEKAGHILEYITSLFSRFKPN